MELLSHFAHAAPQINQLHPENVIHWNTFGHFAVIFGEKS